MDEFIEQVKKETDRADALMDSRELATKESYEECIQQYRKVSTHEEGLRMCPEPGDADKGYIRYVTPPPGLRWFCEVRFDEKKVTYKRFMGFFD